MEIIVLGDSHISLEYDEVDHRSIIDRIKQIYGSITIEKYPTSSEIIVSNVKLTSTCEDGEACLISSSIDADNILIAVFNSLTESERLRQ